MWVGVVVVAAGTVAVAATVVAPGLGPSDAGATGATADAGSLNTTRAEAATVARVNEVREERGLAPLTTHSELADLATTHSSNMAQHEYYSHESPDGSSFAARAARTAPACANPSENIHRAPLDSSVRIYGSDRTVSTTSPGGLARYLVQGWLNSSDHRENLLATTENAAISIHVSEKSEIYATMTFGAC